MPAEDIRHPEKQPKSLKGGRKKYKRQKKGQKREGWSYRRARNVRVLIVYLFFLPVMLPSVLPRLGTDSAVRRFPGVWKLLSF